MDIGLKMNHIMMKKDILFSSSIALSAEDMKRNENRIVTAEQRWTVNDMTRAEAYWILGKMWVDATAEQKEAISMAQNDLEAMDLMPKDMIPVVRKPVVGYEGYYEVDQFGRVFGLDRIVTVVDGKRTYEKPLSGKQMKQSMHDKGYKTVSLTKDGKTKMMFVHRIVAEAFLPNPDNMPMVNHKDEDKTNNFIENLEWCTAAYNRTYGKAVEKQAKKLRGRESKKRVAVIQRSLDGEFMNWHSSIKEAAESVNGASGAISAVCKGKRKMAYGYMWEYDGERKEGAE